MLLLRLQSHQPLVCRRHCGLFVAQVLQKLACTWRKPHWSTLPHKRLQLCETHRWVLPPPAHCLFPQQHPHFEQTTACSLSRSAASAAGSSSNSSGNRKRGRSPWSSTGPSCATTALWSAGVATVYTDRRLCSACVGRCTRSIRCSSLVNPRRSSHRSPCRCTHASCNAQAPGTDPSLLTPLSIFLC